MAVRNAYISSLGTTGVLIVFALLMLAVVGAFVAFDRWPNQAVAEPVPMQLAPDAPSGSRPSLSSSAVRSSAGAAAVTTAAARIESAAALRQVAADAGRTSSGAASPRAAMVEGDHRVVSQLPAPDTDPNPPAAPSAPATAPVAAGAVTADPSGGNAPHLPLPPSAVEPTEGGALTDVTGGVGDSVGGLSPELGTTVRSTGSAADGTVRAVITPRG
jgi:hypothetical protein